LIEKIAQAMQERGAHPARTLVLLPFAQLIPVARQMWAQRVTVGFTPRFETSVSWTRSVGATAPDALDISLDRGRDLLTAQSLLARAGLGAMRDFLSARLLESAYALAPKVAAVAPSQRGSWGDAARTAVAAGLEGPTLALEAALSQVALEWALASAYPTDVLFVDGGGAFKDWDCVIVLQGFQGEPLTRSLQTLLRERVALIALDNVSAHATALGSIALHAASDSDDEAERAAACVLHHIELGHVPVALAATDRVLTRRIRAMLDLQGVAIRDETGWKLSTTRAAAHVMACLRACRWDASSDAVLDWLKNAPAFEPQAVAVIERQLRRAGIAQWRAVTDEAVLSGPSGSGKDLAAAARVSALLVQVAQEREDLARSRPLVQWLQSLRLTLQRTGVFAGLSEDAAGVHVLDALRLGPQGHVEFDALPQAAGRLSLAEFSAWVDAVLEAASFAPLAPGETQVVILPLSQMLARPFAALVLPGCDEVRLNPSPEPSGHWTPMQRAALGLPSREEVALATRAAWRHALATPCCDVMWRRQDDSGEPLLPSTLVQSLQTNSQTHTGVDVRIQRELEAHATVHPSARGNLLPLQRISATAYQDLRRCPYRFFALRQLGLQESVELETEVDKRDFGLWLHAVLKAFHDALKQSEIGDESGRRTLIDTVAHAVTTSMQLDEAEFLPFAAAWSGVRDGYLSWLAVHEASGARFDCGESAHEQRLGELTLFGKIDRIDHLPDDSVVLIDYKTESATQTGERVKQPLEDTQLAFYAALLPQDTLRAAYVNVGEKGGSKSFEQEHVVSVRDALIEGLLHDMERIQNGAVLVALGEGSVCDFCAARGLCRKDFWAI
jgi:ATP-dependent helicase/nuclease subunit B